MASDLIHPDLDPLTSRLIAELSLQDIEEITGSRKGKARVDAPLSDEEIAFRLQHEAWVNALRDFDDYSMAKSLNDAIERDSLFLRVLSIVEEGAQDDRRAAQALSDGHALPPLTAAQRLLQDPRAINELSSLARSEDDNTVAETVNKAITGLVTPMQGLSLNKNTKRERTTLASEPKIQCTGCGDTVKGSAYLKGPCGHDYCGACISNLVSACIRDESLYPPRCCSQPFPTKALVQFLTLEVTLIYNTKRIELDVPSSHRVYCQNPSCSKFLGSSKNAHGDIQCSRCGTTVCPKCQQLAHVGEKCSENEATLAVRELARIKRWQTCPGCTSIVELQVGCYHITCRCRFQFCYLCASPWKNCRCPQWDEARLLDTAQFRVEQENAGRAPVAPVVLREQVRQMANTLRDNHNCTRHIWRRRNGSAHCEECGHWLRDFLLNCKSCHLMACVRCARNRL